MTEIDDATIDEITRRIESAVNRYPNENILAALAGVMSQVLADMSETPEQSDPWIDTLAAALKKDIRKNFHLVIARRAAG